jgi:hypothetical protein
MKTALKFTLLGLLLFTASVATAQTIRIVDNNFNAPQGPNIYSTIQDAHDAADPGDKIYITPSHVEYGWASISKRLHFYGIGFNPDRESTLRSTINGGLVLVYDPEIDQEGPSGSTFQGLHINNIGTTQQPAGKDFFPYTYDGLTIRDNIISGLNIAGWQGLVKNTLIENNLVGSLGIYSTNEETGFETLSRNVVIRNNIITGGLTGAGIFLSYNLFTVNAGFWVQDALFTHNIFYGTRPISEPIPNIPYVFVERTVFNHNLFFGTENDGFPSYRNNSGSNNLIGVDPEFENFDLDIARQVQVYFWDFSWNPSLKPGSPALTAGSDGLEIGPFGGKGFSSYFTGGSPLPYIRTLSTPGEIPEGQNMTIQVEARGN